jgi:hypothetical protein
VEQARLGVGDPGDRLAVDAGDLEEGDQREARGEHRRDVAERLHVLVGQSLELGHGKAEARPQALDQLGLEPELLRHLLERPPDLARREQILDVAVSQPALRGGRADLVQGVTALPQSRGDPGVRQSRRAQPAIAVRLGDHARIRPALQRRQ